MLLGVRAGPHQLTRFTSIAHRWTKSGSSSSKQSTGYPRSVCNLQALPAIRNSRCPLPSSSLRTGVTRARRGSITKCTTSDLHPDVQRVLFTEHQLAEGVRLLGRQLASDYADRQPLLIGTLSGAAIFLADLARAMQPVPRGLQLDFIKASSYLEGAASSGVVSLDVTMKNVLQGRHIIVVEDIVDTGRTLKRLVEHFGQQGAASVAVAALLNKGEARIVDLQPDYRCFECPNEFVVGYGLDYDEHYRSLPYIGVLKPEMYS